MTTLQNNEHYFEQTFDKLKSPSAHYHQIEFEECRFTDCDFSSVTFEKCKFINCEFTRCNLSLVALPYTMLFDVAFSDSKLLGVDFTRVSWPVYHLDHELRFYQCILNDASFFGLTLNELVLEECKLHDVDFREGNFAQARMMGSDFTHSLFMRTNLQGADFSDATDYAINVLENRVQGARFSRYEALGLLECLGIELMD
ncbi:pentapeptide repeat-containing protein [Oceanisphaera sp. KMM 10153]|uniref:pentapeptide repeat-containing protein n=1 Tax=Oceanisphaera submarina TaxID=3390193 RepID=UPI003974BFDB